MVPLPSVAGLLDGVQALASAERGGDGLPLLLNAVCASVPLLLPLVLLLLLLLLALASPLCPLLLLLLMASRCSADAMAIARRSLCWRARCCLASSCCSRSCTRVLLCMRSLTSSWG